MVSFNKMLATLAVALSAFVFSAAPAEASLTTQISGGFGSITTTTASNTFNLQAVFPGGGFISTMLVGQNMFSGGSLWESSVISTGVTSYTVTFTQTGINLGGPAVFASIFNTNNVGTATAFRRMFFDPTNMGLQSILLASSNASGAGSLTLQSAAQLISGPFSLTEVIVVTGATTPGSSVSLDDTVHVPEPSGVALILAAFLTMLGIAAVHMRRIA